MKRMVTAGVVLILLIVVIGIAAVLGHRSWRQHQLAKEWRITSPQGIEDARFLRINGQDQWITVRGENRNNPVILFLHGGPSEANSPFVGFFRPFEKEYVFVQWDQPGAGKTYIRAGKHQPKLTLDGMVDDGIAVADRLRTMLHAPKIILVGQDWGGILGLRMIQKRPDLFRAFIGTGQVVSWLAEQGPQYDQTLRLATAAHDQKTLDALRQIGAPPYRSLEAYRRFGEYFERYKFRDDQAAVGQLKNALYLSPQLSLSEMIGWTNALRSGEDALTPMLIDIDLRKDDNRYSVPVFFIQGGAETITPTSLVADYLTILQAPVKGLDIVPDAGHMVMWQRPKAFLAFLRKDLKLSDGRDLRLE